ncbi:MAG TPA: ABC transporter substrate-binding protein [Longimicrobiaceae bacterium]|jgi:branched-chain amino acid transport system substrate-binding protein|nr:ABC transporter substrate-binding protein [Longimicrobiaceae bacterium]
MMTRRTAVRLTLAVLAAALPLAATACDGSGTGADSARDVTIGGVFSLTGNWATLGVTSKAAMELAVEDVNAYAAGRGIHFVARVEDTKLDPATALAKVQALHGAGVQVVVGPQSSAELAAIKPYVDANAMLVVSQSSTAGSLAVAGDGIFRFTPSDSLEGVAVSALMWDDGIRAVVPIWRADAGNQGLHTATAARFASAGGTVSTGVEYAATATAFATPVASLSAQVHQALATHPAGQVGVYLAGFDEVADVFALAAADPELSSVRWYGSDGVALSAAVLARPAAVAFSERVGFPNPVFGLDPTAQDRWKPVADRIRARAGQEPDAFALGVYDAVWVAAMAYLASPAHPSAADLKTRFVATAGSYYGVTGWTALNAAGDRKYADFDFWGIRASGSTHAWTRVASYDTKLGLLSR